MDIPLANITPLEPLSDYKIHFAVHNGHVQPLDVYLQDAEEWKGWNEWRAPKEKDVFGRRYIFSLIRYYPYEETWRFGGVFEVRDRSRSIPHTPYTVRLSDKYTRIYWPPACCDTLALAFEGARFFRKLTSRN